MARTNEITNPSYETNATGPIISYRRTTGKTATTPARGNAVAAAVGTWYEFTNVTGDSSTHATSSDVDIQFPAVAATAGARHWFSVYLLHGAPAGTNAKFELVISWRNSTGAQINNPGTTRVACPTSGFLRQAFSDVAPAGTVQAVCEIWLSGITDATSRSFRWDGAMFERNEDLSVPAYFDGASVGAAWEGTAHASRSVLGADVAVTDRPGALLATARGEPLKVGVIRPDPVRGGILGADTGQRTVVGVVLPDRPAAALGAGIAEPVRVVLVDRPAAALPGTTETAALVGVVVPELPAAALGAGPGQTPRVGVVPPDKATAVTGAGPVETLRITSSPATVLPVPPGAGTGGTVASASRIGVVTPDRPSAGVAGGPGQTPAVGVVMPDMPDAGTGAGGQDTPTAALPRVTVADAPGAVVTGGTVTGLVVGLVYRDIPGAGVGADPGGALRLAVILVDRPTPLLGAGPGQIAEAGVGADVTVTDSPAAGMFTGPGEMVGAAPGPPRAAAPGPTSLSPRAPITHWELLVAETRTGTVLAELPFIDLTWNTPLNDIGTLTATIPIEEHIEWLGPSDDRSPVNRLRTVLSGEWKFSLIAVFNDTAIIAGPLITSTPVTGDANVTVGCAELGALLKRRKVRTPGTDPAGLGADLALGPTSLPQLARLLLEKATASANGPGWDLPLILPDLTTKGEHVRNYVGSDLADYWTRLSDLAGVQDGPDLRFEPELTDEPSGRKLWWRVRIGQPWLGTWIDGENPTRPPWTFDLGAGLRDLTTDRDASGMTMRTFVPGQARTEPAATTSSTDTSAPQDAAKPIGSAADLTLVGAGYPILEDVDGDHTSATAQSTLDAWAVAGVAANKAPVEAWNVTVDGASSPRLGQWRIGDTATFVVHGQHLVEDGEHERRIVGASGDAGTDVTLVLTAVPAAV